MSDKCAARLTESREGGFQALRLENRFLEATVLPSLGGRIWNLRHKPTQTQWLWHNPSVPLQAVELGTTYDDYWAGGWEELFPNDAGGVFQGRELPDHGEWWSQPWEWEIVEAGPGRVSVRLWRSGTVVRTECEKWIVLEAGTPRLRLRYRITNCEPAPLHFLFKQHLALAVTPAHRLELPGGKVLPVDPAFGTLLGPGGPHEWPLVPGRSGATVDLRVLPAPKTAHREFVYVSELPEGWCGVRDTLSGAALRLHFPRAVFPYTWLFLTYGGWRGLYTVVLEPCTNMPKDLDTALRSGRCAQLRPQEALECEVQVILS